MELLFIDNIGYVISHPVIWLYLLLNTAVILYIFRKEIIEKLSGDSSVKKEEKPIMPETETQSNPTESVVGAVVEEDHEQLALELEEHQQKKDEEWEKKEQERKDAETQNDDESGDDALDYDIEIEYQQLQLSKEDSAQWQAELMAEIEQSERQYQDSDSIDESWYKGNPSTQAKFDAIDEIADPTTDENSIAALKVIRKIDEEDLIRKAEQSPEWKASREMLEEKFREQLTEE
jgi:hypothetical protein